ncbi:MAG: gliding motility-associated C-terminal domain-containing protein, partial [Leadbetterella sp.]|nr:gliding motility-associated C-terminal domain-containing protein [Leadbetterella sp.]
VVAGTYTATCTTSCGTSGNSNSVSITTGQAPTTPTIAANKTSICITEKAILTATGCEGGTITWSNEGVGSTKEVTAGTYTATCTTNCGTSGNSNSVTISVGSVPTAPTIVASKNEICGNEEVTLTASNCTGTVKWSNDKTGTSIKVTQPGDYAAVCVNTCGESGNSNIVKIINGAVPNAPLITTDRVNVCGTEKARLVAVGCSSTIEWSTGETGDMIQVGAGSYTAKCKNSCGISLASNIIKVETGGKPSAPSVITDKTSICGADSAKLTASICSGTVKWSNGIEGTVIFVKSAGTYTATCSNTCGISIASEPVVIGTGGIPSAPNVTASATKICAGDSVTITAAGCNGTVTWSTGATGGSIKVKTVGSYTAKCTNTCGTSLNSQSVVIEIKTTDCGTTCNLPALVITASKTVVCNPEDITLSTSGCTGGSIVWSNGKTGNSIVVNPVVTTTYTAICKKDNCLSPVSNTIEIKVQKATKPIVACATDIICLGESITLRAYECDGQIKWSNGMIGHSVDVKPTTTSKYTAVCVIGTCESEKSDTLCIYIGSPNKPFVTCKTSTVCIGENAIITAQGCTGTVVWANGQTGSVLTYTPTAAGTYSFTAKCKSIGGTCESETSNVVSIVVGAAVPKPSALAEIKNTCPFETVDLNNAILGSPSNADAKFEFHVSNSPNSTLITTPGMVTAGNYYLFERSKVGCYSDPVLVKVKIEDCGDGGINPDSTKFVDISIKKTADSILVPVNKFVDYTVVVKNLNTTVATNLVVRDIIPAGLVIESVSSNAKFENGAVIAKIASLSKTDSVKFTYRAKVTAAGKIENKAELFAVDQIDQVLSNNTSIFTINDVATTDLVGLSKNVGTITKIGNNKFEVPFTFNIANMGATKLTKVKLVDDLGVTFGNGVEILDDTIVVTAAAGLKANPNFTGRGSNTSLLIDSLSSIEVGKTLSVSFKVKVDITNASKTEFFNTAKVFAGATQAISDVSTSGTNPDPDGNGSPLDNDEPTKISFSIDSSKVGIATALSIIDSSFVDDFTYEVKYMALVKNIGFSELKNVYLVDSLSKTFPDSIQFTIEGQPTVSASSKLVVNTAFDGDSDYRLTLPDTTSKLAIGKVDSVFFTVHIKYGKNYGPYLNNVIGFGTSTTGAIVKDSSNAGTQIVPLSSMPTVLRIPKDSTVANNLVDLIEIPGGFSPNNDDINESLESIVPEGVEVEMFEIYNRWGHLVWKYTGVETIFDGYTIKWDATSNTGMRFGPEGVPDGTYYYSVKVKNQAKVRNGFITVAR